VQYLSCRLKGCLQCPERETTVLPSSSSTSAGICGLAGMTFWPRTARSRIGTEMLNLRLQRKIRERPCSGDGKMLGRSWLHGELLFMRRLAVGIAHRSATASCSCRGWQVRAFERPLFPPACRPQSLGAYASGYNDDGKPPASFPSHAGSRKNRGPNTLGRRVPMRRSINGWETGAKGTV
jgi:hypothetical protein